MADLHRIRQKKAITEAEGYLELSIGFSDRCSVARELQVRLAERALEAIRDLGVQPQTWRSRTLAPEKAIPESGRSHILYLTGQAYRAMQRYTEAVPFLEDAAKLDSGNILIWLALAWCYKRIDRLDLAIQSLESGMSVDDNEAILHYNLACYWSLAGNAQLALRYLAQSFDIDPDYRQLVADESDFDAIRGLPGFQALTGVVV